MDPCQLQTASAIYTRSATLIDEAFTLLDTIELPRAALRLRLRSWSRRSL